jgi:LysM repeat protein
MKPSYARIALYLLVMALLVAGLAGCERRAEVREVDTIEPAATGAAPEMAGTVVAVTQPPAAETSAPEAEATAVPSEEATAGTEPETSEPEGSVIWHTVQRDETLSSIARRYGTTWQTIVQANGLVNPNQIYVGQKLKIPTGSTGSSTSGATGCRIKHTVKQGEWVWQIARNYSVSPYDILAANGLTIQTANTIYAGMVLCIP